MTDKLARILEQVQIDTEPYVYTFLFQCEVYAPAYHGYCEPSTCIEAAMQFLDSRNLACYCGEDHN